MPYDRAVIEQSLNSLREQCPDRVDVIEAIGQTFTNRARVGPPVANLEERCRLAAGFPEIRVKRAGPNDAPRSDFRFLHVSHRGVPVSPMSSVFTDLGGAIHRVVKYSDWGDEEQMYALFYNLVWHALTDRDWQRWVEYFRLCAEGNWPLGYVDEGLYVLVEVNPAAAA